MLKQKEKQFRTALQKKIHDVNEKTLQWYNNHYGQPDTYQICLQIHYAVLKDKELYFLYRERVLRIQSEKFPTLIEA